MYNKLRGAGRDEVLGSQRLTNLSQPGACFLVHVDFLHTMDGEFLKGFCHRSSMRAGETGSRVLNSRGVFQG